jgi:hypothetical protein
MSEATELADLVSYLVRTTRLTRPEAVRLINEVLSFLDERPEEFVCRRHRELRAEGLSNPDGIGAMAVSRAGLHGKADTAPDLRLRRSECAGSSVTSAGATQYQS